MNRLPVTAIDSDDSESDWDSTVAAELPRTTKTPLSNGKGLTNEIEGDYAVSRESGDYATVTPRPRTSLQIQGQPEVNLSRAAQKGHVLSPTSDTSADTSGVFHASTNPPHLTSFQAALKESSEDEAAPDLPSRRYNNNKGSLYTVPEADATPQSHPTVAVNWDDSDAEEAALREIQTNQVRERQRMAERERQMERERKNAGGDRPGSRGNDNLSYSHSPRGGKKSESTLEKWAKQGDVKAERSYDSMQKSDPRQDVVSKSAVALDLSSSYMNPQLSDRPMVPEHTGNKIVFYFEEGSPHYLQVNDDEVNAYLPEKVDMIERLIRRMWREIFSILRIITSFCIIMVVELLLYLTKHLMRPLFIDVLGSLGDHLIKPFFTVLFNAIVQPIMAFVWNTGNAGYHAIGPCFKCLGNLCGQLAILVKAFRLCIVNWNGKPGPGRGEMVTMEV